MNSPVQVSALLVATRQRCCQAMPQAVLLNLKTESPEAASPTAFPKDHCNEEGNAIVEFIFGMVMLIVPTLWLVLALSNVQATIFAAESASREAARMLAMDASQQQQARAQAVVAFADFGLPAPEVDLLCEPYACTDHRTTVTVTVRSTVTLPMVPEWSGLNRVIPIVSTTQTPRDGVTLQ